MRGMRPHPPQLGQNFLNDYILVMYDCKCLTTPGCRQCTPVTVDVNNKSIFFTTKAYGLHSLPVTGIVMIYMYSIMYLNRLNYGQLISVYAIRVIVRNALHTVSVFLLLIRASACPCLSSSSC